MFTELKKKNKNLKNSVNAGFQSKWIMLNTHDFSIY